MAMGRPKHWTIINTAVGAYWLEKSRKSRGNNNNTVLKFIDLIFLDNQL